MTYSIGQVIFGVLKKKNQVYPMRVIEIITKKTLQGEVVSYLLQAGSDPSSTIMFDQLDGEVFNSADLARKTLVIRATSQINKLVDVAVEKSAEWYGTQKTVQTIKGLPDLDHSFDDDDQLNDESSSVILPDGTIAKVKLPTAI